MKITGKRLRPLFGAIAIVGAASVVLAGCSSSSSTSPTKSAAAGDTSAVISTNGSEPQNPLIPSNTTETGGGKIVTSIFEGLVSYDAKGATVNEVAKSIKSSDQQNWDIKLNSGWKFTDGTAVTAESFTKAWDWAAKFSNAQSAGYFFSNFKGFDAAKDSDLDLTVVSPTEFKVALTAPQADFPLSLGYSAFYPLPASFYKDTKAFGQNPVGNGPYKLKSATAWTHNVGINLVTNKDYKGKRKPVNGGLDIKFYTTTEAAYADVQSGNLDILDAVPASDFATYKSDFPNTNANQAAAIFQSVTIPSYLAHFGEDKEGKLRREAISLAINRAQVTKVIFQGTRTPAKDFTSPTIDGYSGSLKGNDVLTYNKTKAKKLWAEANAISPYSGTFSISYNADGDHKTWVDAVANSISSTLGIKAEGKSYPIFSALLADESAHKMTGAFRSGWQADYPSLYDFLAPLYGTGQGSNYGQYTSKEFDNYMTEGSAKTTVAAANKVYQSAQELLLKDLPAIPLWYSNVTGVWSTKVDNVKFGWDSVPLYFEVSKK
ncbi:ABC transporter substrate-binding protein [Frondihabitans sucicola]|uniref:ABC transporter substrate-binding protein n=1 Tax=Frondihabitans sucicola TaxID=1268041 RepID=A0ABM8GNK1_9MICO|nr:ABC transporter substrate-binding protein [Frondihabitans sucicola]BDZ49817.1 ABC transporter substrate-binding protein [Frondihabitans sucicola]